jgi:hypothetical protein
MEGQGNQGRTLAPNLLLFQLELLEPTLVSQSRSASVFDRGLSNGRSQCNVAMFFDLFHMETS